MIPEPGQVCSLTHMHGDKENICIDVDHQIPEIALCNIQNAMHVIPQNLCKCRVCISGCFKNLLEAA